MGTGCSSTLRTCELIRSIGVHRFLHDGRVMKSDSSPKMMEWKAGKAYEVEAHMGMVSGLAGRGVCPGFEEPMAVPLDRS